MERQEMDILYQTTIKNRKWTWTCHVMHTFDNIWTRKIMNWQPTTCRSPGIKGISWRDEIKRHHLSDQIRVH